MIYKNLIENGVHLSPTIEERVEGFAKFFVLFALEKNKEKTAAMASDLQVSKESTSTMII